MRTKTYTFWRYYYGVVLFLIGCLSPHLSYGQAHIRVRVLSIQTLNNQDCDGFLAGNSDFAWEYIATDNTIGLTNNNTSTAEIALSGHAPYYGSVISADGNYAEVGGDNGPYTVNAPNSAFDPDNGIFFDHDYVCPSDVPTQMRIQWVAYEADVFDISQGQTPGQNQFIAVPATPGTVTQTYTASGSAGGCNQTYRITFEVTRTSIVVNAIPDNICGAQFVPVDGSTHRYAWCPNATLEPGEPNRSPVSNNRSRWFYFIAPASGRVDIDTDNGGTDFGTYFEIYHAADGPGCTAGFNPFAIQVKNKFEYLSLVDYADNGGFLNLGSQADISINTCTPVLGIGTNALVAGETYYIQMTSDNANQRGYIEISISDDGGSPAEPYDIPCRSTNVTAAAQNTTPTTFGGGSPFAANLTFGCATDRETGNFYFGSDPTQFHAYDYNNNATNNGNIDESLWARFTAPNSGRIYFEGDVRGVFNLNESENTALFGYDARFAPGRPADYSCANLNNLNAAEGGTGILGANPTAILTQSCLEPGYMYYGMIDPSNVATGSDAHVWFYDPSASDPLNNPPGNDILCLTMLDTLYRIPVVPFDSVLPFAAVAGSNVRACREFLAGEPASNSNPALRADQTIWHYFVAPASGVVDINLRAYIGMNRLNYAIYPLLNNTSCYGGLAPATFTQNGLPTGAGLVPIAQGTAGFTGTTVSLCCLMPGAVYAVQLDGGSPGDQGQYIIEYIHEIEVYAGDSRYVTQDGDTINYNSNDTAYICYGDTIFPGTMLNGLGQSTVQIPGCIDTGFVLHNIMPIPDPIANVGFTYIDSIHYPPFLFINNGNGSGSFGNPLYNTVYYVSSLADEASSWGSLTCTSASMENGAPVVFLQQIVPTSSYNPNNCTFTFSATGGLPAYNGSMFNYIITNSLGDTMTTGTLPNNAPFTFAIPVADVYTITMTDSANCDIIIVINATPCLDPCINNPVRITPSPINSSIYSCLPGGAANVTLFLNGGDPTVNGSSYSVTVSGSSIAGQNGVYSQAPSATPTPFSFQVNDGDAWQIIVMDVNSCRDTANGTFVYNINNCPNYCNINPIVATPVYNCFPNRTALVEVTIGGGAPSLDGSYYLVTTSGSTVFGQTFSNAQVAGTVGGTTQFSFLLNDGDTWQVVVFDTVGCSDTISGTYSYNITNCPNLCTNIPVEIYPNPLNTAIYSCNGNGTATVTLFLTGGDPSITSTLYSVQVSGSSVAGQNGTTSHDVGSFTFTVADGDAWQVIVTDVNTCADTAAGTFLFNNINCPNICNLLNISASNASYNCQPNGTAIVSVVLGGGKAAYDGSNYFVTISGSTVGGNVVNQPVAGVVGSTVTYQFNVGDGDNWQLIVRDVENCADTIGGTFVFNATNCPNFCNLRPLEVAAGNYTCDFAGNATFTVAITGGVPSYSSAANYTVIVTGSTAGSNTTGTLVPGTVNDTTFYTINVADGDNWQVFVSDALGCNDAVQGVFIWNAANCGNLCNDPAYVPISLNGGNGFTYDCDGLGHALVTFNITGGAAGASTNFNNYTALATVNGATTVYQVPSNGTMGTFNINVANGDSWSVQVFDYLGCDTFAIPTTIFNTVNAVAATDVSTPLLVGQFGTLIGTSSTGNNLTYRWTPSTRVTNPTAVTSGVQPLVTTMFTLEVMDNMGCTDVDSVEVPVGACVPLHAGFTPNNDGVNDLWQIPCLTLFDNTVEVYNRWGQQVYQRENYDGTWDGKHGGQDLPAATYYYAIHVYYPNLAKPVLYKGTVTILR